LRADEENDRNAGPGAVRPPRLDRERPLLIAQSPACAYG